MRTRSVFRYSINIRVKSLEEHLDQLGELIHRHRRRYIAKYLRPCPSNCVYAASTRKGVQGCGKCGSANPEQCREVGRFVPMDTKEELQERFAEDLRTLPVLQHQYRDLTCMFWSIDAIDDGKLDEAVVELVEFRREKT